jgi:hypothetical protein
MENFKAYLVLTTGDRVYSVDADEVPAMVKAFNSRNFALVRSGMINPAYVIGVVEDERRMRAVASGHTAHAKNNRSIWPDVGATLECPQTPEIARLDTSPR